MLIAAAAVVSAVIFAAGCVTDDDDADVIGAWYHGDDKLVDLFILADNNTALSITKKDDAGRTGIQGPFPYINVFTWSADGNKVTFALADDFTVTATFDEKTGSLTVDSKDNKGIIFEPVDLAGGTEIDSVWYYEGDTVSDVAINMAEGSGVEYRLEAVLDKNGNPTGEVTESVNQYTWEADNEDNAVVTYSDGTVEHLICGEDGTLTSDLEDDALYSEMPGRLDAFMSMLAWAADKLA